MREFLAQAFPYSTYINADNTVDGIPFIQGEGGAIPQYLGDYYPTNISWPGLNMTTGLWMDPNTNAGAAKSVGSAAWWWAEITTPASPYYDPDAAACKNATCTFPLESESGAVPFDEAVDTWISDIRNLTGNAIAPTRWDPSPIGFIVPCTFGCPPGTSPDTTFVTGWLPDYPDPTDYVTPFYYPDASYTYSSAMGEVLEGYGGFPPIYNGCSANSADTFANLVYWAHQQPSVPQACQGTAYAVMLWALEQAAVLPAGTERTLYYNLGEHVANGLVLYVYDEQEIGIGTQASWVNPAGVDANVMAPGQLWFQWFGNNVE
jgi:hypothetical protein